MTANRPVRIPFRNHPLHYPFINVAMIACGPYLALRIFGVL
jgi:hypothetical protein